MFIPRGTCTRPFTTAAQASESRVKEHFEFETVATIQIGSGVLHCNRLILSTNDQRLPSRSLPFCFSKHPLLESSSPPAAMSDTLSPKIGGRVVSPNFPVVDGSPPSELDKSFDESLQAYVKENIPLESTEGIQRRERVLNRMGALSRDWIRSVCIKRGLSKDVVDAAGGQLFTSGSYRLGVHEPGADIDTILVVPNVCTKQDFFGTMPAIDDNNNDNDSEQPLRDPDSLAERIRRHPDVTNFVPIEGAAVPVLTFDWEGINIDLLFARLNTASVPPGFDIDNDAVLDGVDSGTEKSLNGPRVTNLIAALVSGTPQRYQTFLSVVRCVRKWAKARGLYSNKMGYWGGVNINIAVAFCVQLYPNKSPASLLRMFFLVFKTWRWPKPIQLTATHDAEYGLQVWDPRNPQNNRQVAPMLTPAYPSMNSTMSVSRQTLQIMTEEFERGHDIVAAMWQQHKDNPTVPLDWSELFRPSDFFIAYPYYMSLCMVGPTQEDAQAWVGFVESRLRKLVSDMLARSLPLSKIQLWPKKIEACIADRSSLLTMAQRRNSATYVIGFQVDKLRMRGSQLNIEMQMNNFRNFDLARFQPLITGMDVLVKTFTCKTLPAICFEMYEGGKLGAMKRRRMLRNQDPKRIERRKAKRLAELRAKMAKAQERKVKKQAHEEDRNVNEKKRKRTDSDAQEDDTADLENLREDEPVVKEESEKVPQDDGEGMQEDLALLENAMDNIQESEGGTMKTREDAEADRRKLLAGELLVEGADVPSDDEDFGYTGDGVRETYHAQVNRRAAVYRDIRALPMEEEEAELLRKAGYTIVSDAETETKIIGGNMPNPFRSDEKAEEDFINMSKKVKCSIKFRTKFDIVELDAAGFVIDKGDDDFTPSKTWVGRKAGFEFKLGERGLGYYRTGAKVIVPSNTAY